MIVVTADHGEHFGERGLAYHQFSLFDELLHVPLVVKPPSGLTGCSGARDDLLSLVDVYPTILSELGLSVPDTVQGNDLFGSATRETVFAEYGEPTTALSVLKNYAQSPIDGDILNRLDHALQYARTRDEKYIRVHGGEDRVYDVGEGTPRDTLQRADRHDEPAALISETLGTEMGTEPTDPADPKVRDNLEALGYR